MNRSFWLKNTVVPVIIGIVCSIFAIAFFNANPAVFSPVYEGSVLAKHEATADTSAIVDKSFDEIEPGDCIGKISVSGGVPLVADAPYHQLGEVISYDTQSAAFGKAGYVYLLMDNKHLAALDKAISFTAEGCFDKHDYVLVGTKTFGTVDEVRAYTPDINRGIIAYAQQKGKIGVKNAYKVLVFEEVQL